MSAAFFLGDGRIAVFGGFDDDGDEIQDAEIVELGSSSGNANVAGRCAEAMERPSFTQLTDGDVIAVGGGSPALGGRTAVAIWRRQSMTFEPAAPLVDARLNAALVSLPDNRVLAIGGWKNGTVGVPTSTELFSLG